MSRTAIRNLIVSAGLLLTALLGVFPPTVPAWAGADTATTDAEVWKMQAALTRGGLLYDKWWKVIDAQPPTQTHTAYPPAGKYADKPADTWRCKECHGWDYMGKDGAYAKGKHHTGIPGIRSMDGAPVAAIVATLKNATHGYEGRMSNADLNDLALFVSKGQVDMDRYIDRKSRQISAGDALRGEAYYQTICARCHGAEGLQPKDMKPLGEQVEGNPWEVLHKILNGHPGEEMPGFRALGMQMPPPWGASELMVPVDVLAYIRTLPKKR